MIDVVWEGFSQGMGNVWTLARVVIPLMIILEVFKANQWLDRANAVIAPPFRKIGLSEHGAFPVVVAVVFGLTFGSGVIIANIREGKLSAQEIRISGTFMALCHAMIEDTLLFAVLGVPLWYLVVPRTAAAFVASYGVFRWLVWYQTRGRGSDDSMEKASA